MICKKCNHKLPDDSEFCQYCGNTITNPNISDKGRDCDFGVKSKNVNYRTNNNGKKQKIAIIATLILLAIVALTVVTIVLVNKYFTDETPNTPTQTYTEVYDWLVDNGNLVAGETLVYSEARGTNGVYKIWAYGRDDNVLFKNLAKTKNKT